MSYSFGVSCWTSRTCLLGEGLEGVALVLEPLQTLWEGGAQFVDTFQRVVEGDDGAIARVPLYIVDDILGRHPFGVVAGDKVPHDNLVFAAEPRVLCHAHPAMWRSHVVAMDIGIGLLDVVAVLVDGVGDTLDVVVRMVAHLMALGQDTFVELRVLPHIVAHHEEGGLGVKLLQCVENKGCSLRYGAVVEGQIDGLLVTVHSPVGLWIKPAEVNCRLLYKHSKLSTFNSDFSLPKAAAFGMVHVQKGSELLLHGVGLLLVEGVLEVEHLLHDVGVEHHVMLGIGEAHAIE